MRQFFIEHTLELEEKEKIFVSLEAQKMLIQEDLTLSEARSETDLCVCMVSNCSRHQSNSSSVEMACDNAGSSEGTEPGRIESNRSIDRH